jgi:YidC/Oxa1 family membrane protein insertase
MEKRFILALFLTGAVVALTPVIFPRAKTPAPAAVDSTAVPLAGNTVASGAATNTAPVLSAAPPPMTAADPGAHTIASATASATASAVAVAETVTVNTPLSRYSFSSIGAAPFAVRADSYPALNGTGGVVTLKHGREPLLRYRVVTAHDTIRLDRAAYTNTQGTASDGAPTLTFTGATGGALGDATATVRYSFSRDNYLATTTVSVAGVQGPAFLLVDLPTGFDTQEADTVGDIRLLAYSVKPTTKGAIGVPFAKLDSGEKKLEVGPLTWAVAKSKYFLVGLLVPQGGKPFAEAHLEGGARTRKLATNGQATVVMPLDNGSATFEVYAGPQSWQRLFKMGREFETANPYGGFLQPVVQPFSTIVMRMLLWMKKSINLNYGWVLVIFGVVIRLIMWPLNQSAMRTSLKMQRIQPELQDVQTKFKNDPQKQQAEIMRVYKEHGMSPFSAFSGCLPALIPMPILMSLFFVFQNTIEFRGVPFLWLHDISLHDPLYILPLAMGASMFLMSWIGMRNMPPNPQTKMMSYLFPVMLTVALINSAAGLSLYYTVQNLAALPQQWLIANERAKSLPKKAVT